MKVNIKNWPKKSNRRKISVQIDQWDTWNLDSTLAMIIYPALLQLKATKHGIPGDFVNDVGGEEYSDQDSFDFYKETHKESWEEAARSWDEVLEKMIWSFEQIACQDYDARYHHGNAEYDWKETDTLYPNPVTGKMEPTYQMIDKNPDDHWYDHVGHKLHEDRIQEGLELFGKYFRALWD
jgi:hypothetical protein